jgi:hypothetical protein
VPLLARFETGVGLEPDPTSRENSPLSHDEPGVFAGVFPSPFSFGGVDMCDTAAAIITTLWIYENKAKTKTKTIELRL